MKKTIIILSLILTVIIGFFLYDKFAYMRVVVKFDDLEPIERQMKVYFKGFNVGKTSKVYPDSDYQNTYMELKLKPANIKLPQNIQAKIVNKNITSRYVNLIYPDSPELTKLKNNSEIQGILSKDINSIVNEKLGSDEIGEIVTDTMGLIDNANNALKGLNNIFTDVRRVINNSENDIKILTSNLAKTSANLEQLSTKLNNSLTDEIMQNSADNVDSAIESIKNIADETDKSIMPILNGILCQTYSSVKNVNDITCGVKKTLKKRFGTGKLFFGRPISE